MTFFYRSTSVTRTHPVISNNLSIQHTVSTRAMANERCTGLHTGFFLRGGGGGDGDMYTSLK